MNGMMKTLLSINGRNPSNETFHASQVYSLSLSNALSVRQTDSTKYHPGLHIFPMITMLSMEPDGTAFPSES